MRMRHKPSLSKNGKRTGNYIPWNGGPERPHRQAWYLRNQCAMAPTGQLGCCQLGAIYRNRYVTFRGCFICIAHFIRFSEHPLCRCPIASNYSFLTNLGTNIRYSLMQRSHSDLVNDLMESLGFQCNFLVQNLTRYFSTWIHTFRNEGAPHKHDRVSPFPRLFVILSLGVQVSKIYIASYHAP